MKEFIHKVFYLINKKDLKKIPLFIFLFLILAILEILGLGLIIPIFGIITNSEQIFISDQLDFFQLQGLNQQTKLVLLSLVMFLIFFIKTLAVISINKKIIDFSMQQRVNIAERLFLAYQEMPYENMSARNSSEFVNNILSLTSVFSSLLMNLFKTSSASIFSISILIFLGSQNIEALLILVLLSFILLFYYDKFFKIRLQNYGKESNTAADKTIKTLNESVNSIKEIRILNKENFFLKKFANFINTHKNYSSRQQLIQIIPRQLLELTAMLFLCFLIFFASMGYIDYDNLLATLGIFALASIRLIPSTNIISQSILQIRAASNAIDRLYLDVKNIESTYAKERSKIEALSGLSFKTLELQNIGFSYKNSTQKLLQNINIKITSGDFIGIFGNSGSGKTTLIDIILGLLSPSTGNIKLNGRNISNNPKSWMSIVSYIPQNISLLDASVIENVCFDKRENINFEKFQDSLKKASIYDYIYSLPDKFDTNIGERGSKISGGQKQRIAIARSIYHDRNVIIMDESTSALDKRTEEIVINEIKSLKDSKTIILISHDLSLLKDCTRIFEIKKGTLIERDSVL